MKRRGRRGLSKRQRKEALIQQAGEAIVPTAEEALTQDEVEEAVPPPRGKAQVYVIDPLPLACWRGRPPPQFTALPRIGQSPLVFASLARSQK